MPQAKHSDNQESLDAVSAVLECLEQTSGTCSVAKQILRQLDKPLAAIPQQLRLVQVSLGESRHTLDLAWMALEKSLQEEEVYKVEADSLGCVGHETDGNDGGGDKSSGLSGSQRLRNESRSSLDG